MKRGFLKKHGLLIIILLLAAFLRLYKISGYMEFLGDQGRDVVIVRRFLTRGDLMFIGPQTSIGNMYLGPWYYYLMAPALLLAGFNPVGPAVLIALAGVATTWLVWFCFKNWFSPGGGLVAAFLYAISPVVIKYSNFSWNPNIMPLFSLLSLWAIWQVFKKREYRWLLVLGFCLGMALNSHYLGLLLLAPTGFYWFWSLIKIKKKKKNNSRQSLKKFLIFSLWGALIFAVLMSPLLLFDLKHGAANFSALKTFFTVRQTTVNLKVYKAIPNLWPLFSQIITRLLAGKNEFWGSKIAVALIFGVAWLIYRYCQDKKKRTILLLVGIWFLSGLIGLGLYKQHIYDHYFAFLFPVPFMLVALIIGDLWKSKTLGKLTASVFFLGLIFLSLKETPFRYQPNNQLVTTKKIAGFINEQSRGEPFNLALIAKQNYDPPYRYFLEMQKASLFDLHDHLADQLFVICEPNQVDCNPIGHPLWEIAAFGWGKIDQEWEINGIRIFRLIHLEEK